MLQKNLITTLNYDIKMYFELFIDRDTKYLVN